MYRTYAKVFHHSEEARKLLTTIHALQHYHPNIPSVPKALSFDLANSPSLLGTGSSFTPARSNAPVPHPHSGGPSNSNLLGDSPPSSSPTFSLVLNSPETPRSARQRHVHAGQGASVAVNTALRQRTCEVWLQTVHVVARPFIGSRQTEQCGGSRARLQPGHDWRFGGITRSLQNRQMEAKTRDWFWSSPEAADVAGEGQNSY